jgi:hypothetical protein
MYSDSVTQWIIPPQEPRYSWEFTQLETADSNWTAEGWLVITHVGA